MNKNKILLELLEGYISDNRKYADGIIIHNEELLKILKKKHKAVVQEENQKQEEKKNHVVKKTAPAPRIIEKIKENKIVLKLEKPSVKKATHPCDIASIYNSIAPKKNLHMAAKTPILALILIDKSFSEDVNFLKKIAKAITDSFCAANLFDITKMEKENNFKNIFDNNNVRLIIVPEILASKSPNLKKATSIRNKTPLILLKNIKEYYTHDDDNSKNLKRSLWKEICQNLQATRR